MWRARQYDVRERGGRLVLTRSRLLRKLDVLGLVALFALAVPLALWLARALELSAAAVLLLLAGGGVAALFVFLAAVRAYRASTESEALVLDRAADRISRGPQLICPASQVSRVEVRTRSARAEWGEDERHVLVLVFAGDEGGELEVAGSRARPEVATYGRRIADYLGRDLVET